MFATDSLDAVFDRMLSLSRAMDHALAPELTRSANYGGARQQVWLPVVDVYETDGSFVIEADLPGVHPENVEISFEQGSLTFKGTRAPTLRTPENGELRVFSAERIAGAFARTVRLPDYADGEKIEARYTNGVLTITVPKAPAALPRKIAITAAESDSRRLNA